jgi:hypothetical protein
MKQHSIYGGNSLLQHTTNGSAWLKRERFKAHDHKEEGDVVQDAAKD